MAHYSKISKVVIDVTPSDHKPELLFWQAAAGGHWSAHQLSEYHGATLPGQDLELLVQRLEDGPSRVHLDIHTNDLEAEVERLQRLGAVRIRQLRNLWIMQDPAGLPFCVIHDPQLSDDGGQSWH
jgi:hypothetical protein